jgi:hypothetical protein
MTIPAFGLGVVLLVACFGKVRDLVGFQLVVARALPTFPVAANTVVLATPTVELVVGASLVSGVRPKAGAWLAVALLGALTIWVIGRLLVGAGGEPCGCAMPVGPQTVSRALAGRNAFLAAVALLVALIGPPGQEFGGLAMVRFLGGAAVAFLLASFAARRSIEGPRAPQVKEHHRDRS